MTNKFKVGDTVIIENSGKIGKVILIKPIFCELELSYKFLYLIRLIDRNEYKKVFEEDLNYLGYSRCCDCIYIVNYHMAI